MASATSPSSGEDSVAVGVASDVRKSTRTNSKSLPSNADLADVGIPEEEEEHADLFVLEQQIWDELENDDDLELDMEIEEEDESVYSSSEEVGSSTLSASMVEDFKRPRSVKGFESESFSARPISAETGEQKVVLNDDDEGYSRTRGSGKGFGRTTSIGESRVDSTLSAKKSEGDEKEIKIKELEAKLKELQSQLNKRNSVEFTDKEPEVNVRERELKIESLEKRLLGRVRTGLRDSNVSNGKPTSTSGKSAAKNAPKDPQTATEETSKNKRSRPPPRQKLGASSR